MQTNLDNIREGNMSQVDIFCYRSSSSLFDDINVPIEKVLSHHYARKSFAIKAKYCSMTCLKLEKERLV